ncbi:hypothetical protein DL96DRAFT_1617268 [Flagelloscypha sp. PMI_526]|nr:hypothetical protein DL96DRAFT_1617268 [Flagelloscypha sp. PMI_526]
MICITSPLALLPLLFSLTSAVTSPVAMRDSNKRPSLHLQPIRWLNCSTNVPAPIQSSLNITNWEGPLPDTLKCGRLDVPIDYEKPFEDENRISVAFSLYTPENSRGTIFYNPGGPGDEAQSSAWLLATNQSQLFSGLEDYEFMMMDTRGTHASSPLNCSLAAYQDLPFGAPKDEAEFERYREKSKSFAESCLTNTNLVKHVGTQETVLDWESIRITLDKDRINLLGVSYGTYFFSEYVQRFPASISLAALDAVIIRGQSNTGTITDEIVAINRMLLRADAYCQSNSTCPFFSQGKGSVVEAWKEILRKAEAGTLIAVQAGNFSVTPDDVRQTVPALLRGTPNYDILLQVMAGALLANNSDASGLVVPEAVDEVLEVFMPLFCPDDHIDDNSLKGSQTIERTIAPVDPNNFHSSVFWQAKLDCSNWPVHGRKDLGLRSVKDFPFLWVSSDFDVNTPTEWASFNYNQTTNSTLVVRHGDGHGSFAVPGPARDLIIEYLRTGNVSVSSNETLATVFSHGTTRNQVANPYEVGFGPEYGDINVLN